MASVESEPEVEASEASEAPEVRVLGWLLLPSGDAVPITGFTPEALTWSAGEAVFADGQARDAEAVLDDIVWALGFDGGFAGYREEGWPRLQAVLQQRGATTRVDMFEWPPNCVGFSIERRAMADRIFFGPSPCPEKVFTGYGHDWERWDRYPNYPTAWRDDSHEYVPTDLDGAVDWVLDHSEHLHTNFPLFGDLLFDPARPACLPLQTYFRRESGLAMRQETYDRARKVAKVFRWCIDRLPGGWVDIVPLSDGLALLVSTGGNYDVVWRDFRQKWPRAVQEQRVNGLTVVDLPGYLKAGLAFEVWHHSRTGTWDQLESHEAEMLHYTSGGGSGHIYPGWHVIRERLLRVRGEYGPPAAPVSVPAFVDGFSRIRMPDRQVVLASELVSIAAFEGFLEASGYGARRRGEPLGPANDGDQPDLPVAVTLADALAYIAWSEKELGLPLRLMTYEEHRALRPRGDRRRTYGEPGEVSARIRLGEALEWSIPRYARHEIAPGLRPPFARRGDTGGAEHQDRAKPTYQWNKVWIPQEDWPPAVRWRQPIPWKTYGGLRFIDAWDAFEWCADGRALGLYWEGALGVESWGEYKCMKVCFRVVVDGSPGE